MHSLSGLVQLYERTPPSSPTEDSVQFAVVALAVRTLMWLVGSWDLHQVHTGKCSVTPVRAHYPLHVVMP